MKIRPVLGRKRGEEFLSCLARCFVYNIQHSGITSGLPGTLHAVEEDYVFENEQVKNAAGLLALLFAGGAGIVCRL